MMRLYEITAAMERILELVENEGEDAQPWQPALDELEGLWEHKAESICKVIRMLEASSGAKEAEAKRLQTSANADQHAADRLKAYLQQNMESIQQDTLNTPLFKLRIQNTPPRVEVSDWKEVPLKYVSGIVRLPWLQLEKILGTPECEPQIDRKVILEHYKTTGEAISGTQIVQGKKLYIR